jgi:uncharacterized repeat protein (TIGR03803 family)
VARVSFRVNPVICLLLIVLVLSFASAFQPAQAQTLTILHSFSGGADGDQPFGSLISDTAGNLYGATNHGGIENANCNINGTGCGTVFELTRLQPGWAYDVIYRFGGYPIDGASPVTGHLVVDKLGNLYGTTMMGGTASCQESQGCGTVFKLSPSPTGWTETLVYNFTSAASGLFWPRSGVVIGKNGNLYGTAFNGGVLAGGVFEVTPSGTESALYTFSQSGAYGENPYGGLVFDQKKRNLYGTTPYGGPCCGTVFKVAADGTETVLHNFSGGADGNTPWAGLVFDKLGNLYGTTWVGGTGCGGNGCGTVFQLAPNGTETILHSFSGPDGAGLWGGVILDAIGNVYGTTANGGTHNSGTVFELTPSGGGWTFRVLHNFDEFDVSDGALPHGSLLLRGGSLYGTTQAGGTYDRGTVFKLNPRN